MRTKQSEEAIAKLRETLKPGDTLHMVLRGVSRSGMNRKIDVYKLTCDDGQVSKQWLSARICKALGYTFDTKSESISVSGCGMDMGFEIVYNLGRVLFPNGFAIPCRACGRVPTKTTDADENQPARAPQCSRGHEFYSRNGDTTGWDNDGGYAMKPKWL